MCHTSLDEAARVAAAKAAEEVQAMLEIAEAQQVRRRSPPRVAFESVSALRTRHRDPRQRVGRSSGWFGIVSALP